MSVSVSFNGTDYTLPTTNDVDWGAALTAFLRAVALSASTASKSETLTGKAISGASNTLSAIPNSATSATSANTPSAIVSRDAGGNFAAAGVTATQVDAPTINAPTVADVGALQADSFQLTSDTVFNLPGTDGSGTPGAATINKVCGKSAIAAGQSSVVITNSLCRTDSILFAVIQQTSADATLTRIERVSVVNGSFTAFGNANATAAVSFTWFLFKRG